MVDCLKSTRDKGFQFDKLSENLKKAGSGLNTKIG
jgi:hypothetical protein